MAKLGLMAEVQDNRKKKNSTSAPINATHEAAAPETKLELGKTSTPKETTKAVRQTFVVDPAQLRKLKLMAADTNRQQKDLINEALELLFTKWEATKNNAISLS